MLWNWYTIDACFLSSSWQIHSNGAFAASCIGVVLLVVALEALRRLGKEYDEYILREFQSRVAVIASSSTPNTGACPASSGNEAQAVQTVTFRASPLQQLVRSVIHDVTFGVAYIVMLLAMYYNGYIIICILIGAGLGKFLCDWMSTTVKIGGPLTTAGKVGGNTAAGIEEPSVCCG